LDRWTDRGVVCIFSIFNAGGSICGCMRVYTHTHKHTAKMGYSDVSLGVGMRHLEGPKNLDGLNLGIHIFRYVYKAYNGGNRKGVQNRFVSKLFRTFTTFPSQGTVNRICYPCIWIGGLVGGGVTRVTLNLRSA